MSATLIIFGFVVTFVSGTGFGFALAAHYMMGRIEKLTRERD